VFKINLQHVNIKAIEQAHLKWATEHFKKILDKSLRDKLHKHEEDYYSKFPTVNNSFNKLIEYCTEIKSDGKFRNKLLKDKMVEDKFRNYFELTEEAKANNDILKLQPRSIIERYDTFKKSSDYNCKIKKSKEYINNNKYSTNKIFSKLIENNKSITPLFESIIIGKPDKLRKIIKDFVEVGNSPNNPNTLEQEIIHVIFDYDTFTNNKELTSFDNILNKWSGYQLTHHLGVRICPYCNRNFTTTLSRLKSTSKDKELNKQGSSVKKFGRARPQLDHYYPKAQYPYLAISLYNLIPSCNICNSSLKGSIDFYDVKHLHPYENELDRNYKFKARLINNTQSSIAQKDHPKNINISRLSEKINYDQIEIEVELIDKNNEIDEKSENSLSTFAIIEHYELHTHEVADSINLLSAYNITACNQIIKLLQNTTEQDKDTSAKNLLSDFKNSLMTESPDKRVLGRLLNDVIDDLILE